MKIAFDLDNVLADTMAMIVKFHNHRHNTSFKQEDFLNYDLEKTWGGTKEETVKKLLDFFETEYFDNNQPRTGAKDGIEALNNHHDLIVVTARPDTINEKTKCWVEKHFANKFDHIFFTNHFIQDKQGKNKTKSQLCDDLGIDVMVEDCLQFALDCANGKRNVLLLDCPWNQCESLPDNVYRVHSWGEIVDKIADLSH